MFSKELEVTISQAYQEAREKRHEFLTVEHLLLALLDNASALGILSACGADLVKLGVEIRQVLEETVPVLSDDDSRDTQPTIGFQRVLQRALYHVQSAGKLEVTGSNALVAIFSEKDSYATYLLSKHDVTRLDVVNFISHGISKVDPDGTESDSDTLTADADEAGERSAGLPKSNGPSRFCAGGAKTTRCWLAKPVSAKPRWPKDWRCTSLAIRCQRYWRIPPSTHSISVLFWRAPSTVVILRNA
jgi:ATP-dependent Clp protease ATP-binding subunit ClpA